ncbi:MAG: hypothetical protein ACRDWD_11860 [Acidimicrobiia bacterium]
MTHATITSAPSTVDPDARLARTPTRGAHVGCHALEHDQRAMALAWLAQQLRWEDQLTLLRAGALQPHENLAITR